jgi:hypothetical protein
LIGIASERLSASVRNHYRHQFGTAIAIVRIPHEVQVKAPAVRHQVNMKQIRTWLEGTCRSPKEKITKERLKALLA